jgi:hypothetical protein
MKYPEKNVTVPGREVTKDKAFAGVLDRRSGYNQQNTMPKMNTHR